MTELPVVVVDAIERSAAPMAVRRAVERVVDAQPGAADRLTSDEALLDALLVICGASRSLVTPLTTDPAALDGLSRLDVRERPDAASPDALRRWKEREYLRIAARDLLGIDPVERTTAMLSALARDLLAGAHALVAPPAPLAVIGMGKLAGNELNYASDIDVMFVGDGDPQALDRSARRIMEIARQSFRVDANLRPQGRDGPLVRTLESYEAYWARWAEPWEFQALLKARAVAGATDLGDAFDESSAEALWSRIFSPDDIRSLRHLKARTEADLARKGISEREVKRGRGGIRDIEFAVQLLQLVHGRLDDELRTPTTLAALDVLATAGYIDPDDSAALAGAYRFLRNLEHRLQLWDGHQAYTLPTDVDERTRIARTMGYRDGPDASALESFTVALSGHQATVRSIHERLYFRPLLEAFASADAELLARPGAVDARLAAFGFSDSLRTRAAVRELTRGIGRSSRLMQQMLPLLFAWLSESPDPDLGLLCLRNLVGEEQRATTITRIFRESPEAARCVSLLVGTSRIAADMLQRNVDVAARLPMAEQLQTQAREVLIEKARTVVEWRDDLDDRQAALRRWKDRHTLGVIARDVLRSEDVGQVGRDLAAIAEAAMQVALESLRPQVPFAVVALGRFGGGELSYASDLDVVFAYDGTSPDDAEEGLRIATGLRRFVQGATPSARLWEVDVDLRPEGKQGPLARSIDGYSRYFREWALVWERQAMLRARPVAGDAEVGARFLGLLDDFVWEPGLSLDDAREIKRIKARIDRERIAPSEDAQFHLKLGKGALADVEWTVQFLQLRHRVKGPSTLGTLDALHHEGVIPSADAAVLAEAYRFCEQVRNRLFLVRSQPGDSLPPDANLVWLARSFDTTPSALREQYRKVTRRSRNVVERLFWGR